MIGQHQLNQYGLVYRQTHQFDKNIDILEADHTSGETLISKYLFLNCTYELFSRITYDEETYRNFEINYIEDIFFNLKGDYRWNIYLVMVLSNQDYDKIPHEKRSYIERGKRYARKIILAISDVPSYIPVSKIEKANSSTKTADPLEDWAGILEPNGLTFCLEEYSNKNIECYLVGETVQTNIALNQETQEVDGNEDDYQRIMINKLSLGDNFRNHCFESNSSVDFSKINVLYGANGSGKTSILEAIEYGITGEILREKLGGEKSGDIWDGKIELSNGDKYNGLPIPRDRKKRETIFYQNREKRIDKLNQAFHTYNYFSTEAVYSFSFNKGGQPEYENEFEKIVFGEEVKTYERNLIRHKEGFEKELIRFSKELEGIKKESLLYDQLSDIELDPLRVIKLNKLITDTKIKTEEIKYDNNIYELSSKVTNMYRLASRVDFSINDLNKLESCKIDNPDKINNKLTENTLKLKGLRVEIIQLSNEKLQLETSVKKEEKLKYENEKILLSLQEENTNLNKVKKIYDEYKTIYTSYATANSRLKIEKLVTDSVDNINVLNDFISKNDLTFPKDSYLELEEERQHYSQLITKENDKLQKLEKEYNFKKLKNEKFQNIVTEIKSLGYQLLKEKPEVTVCALCGVNHGTADKLSVLIKSEITDNQKEQTDIKTEIDDLYEIINVSKKKLRNIIAGITQWEVLFNKIMELNVTKVIEIDFSKQEISLVKVNKLFTLIKDVLHQEREKLTSLKLEASQLDHNKFTIERINKAFDHLKRVPLLYKLYDEKQSVNEFYDKFYSIYKQNTERIEKLIGNNRALDINLGKYNKQAKKAIAILHERTILEKELDLLVINLEYLDNLFNQQLTNYVDIKYIVSIKNWYNSLKTLLEEIEKINSQIQKKINNDEQKQKLEILNKEEGALLLKKDRSTEALKILQKLRLLNTYNRLFLSNNIKEISNRFVSLHSPREFSNLSLNGQGKLVAKRFDKEEAIPIHLMSTGQRTAVALSVFFTLYLNMHSAPKFILLDEPMSNMDDLNVLSLMDFFRELAISGTQIIITTANPSIAKLFRRKFSIFKDNFSLINLNRFGEAKVSIEVLSYDPETEEALSKKIS